MTLKCSFIERPKVGNVVQSCQVLRYVYGMYTFRQQLFSMLLRIITGRKAALHVRWALPWIWERLACSDRACHASCTVMVGLTAGGSDPITWQPWANRALSPNGLAVPHKGASTFLHAWFTGGLALLYERKATVLGWAPADQRTNLDNWPDPTPHSFL